MFSNYFSHLRNHRQLKLHFRITGISYLRCFWQDYLQLITVFNVCRNPFRNWRFGMESAVRFNRLNVGETWKKSDGLWFIADSVVLIVYKWNSQVVSCLHWIGYYSPKLFFIRSDRWQECPDVHICFLRPTVIFILRNMSI